MVDPGFAVLLIGSGVVAAVVTATVAAMTGIVAWVAWTHIHWTWAALRKF